MLYFFILYIYIYIYILGYYSYKVNEVHEDISYEGIYKVYKVYKIYIPYAGYLMKDTLCRWKINLDCRPTLKGVCL